MFPKKTFSFSRLWNQSRRFYFEERGAVAIYVGLTSVAMLGFGALVVDGGRLFTVNTELQNAADAAALAGAAELDGNLDAITRATSAAQGALFTNSQSYYNDGNLSRNVNVSVQFLSDLPPSDDTPIDYSVYGTTDPTSARFIRVQTQDRNVGYLLAPVLKVAVGGDGTAPLGAITNAEAVAGMNSVTCKVPPLMICNPAEASLGAGAPFTEIVGQQVLLKQGGSGFWGPGAFGLLRFPADPNQTTGGKSDTSSNGAASFAKGVASGISTGCYSSEVQVEGGQAVGPVEDGVNVRFDMYPSGGPLGGNPKGNSAYKPATNVTKGKYKAANKWEEYTDLTKGQPLPINQPCFDGVDGDGNPNRFCSPMPALNASTDLADYFSTFHSATALTQTVIDAIDAAVDGVTDGVVTMNEVYAWENATNSIPDKTASNSASTVNAENGKPKNYSGTAAPSEDRRTVQVAVVNCLEHNLQGGGSATYPVEAFLNMFLLRPVEGASDNALYVELQKKLEPGVDDALHDIIQLYR